MAKNDFELRLKASGGGQAAGEVRKVAESAEELKERVALGADAIAQLAKETGDGQLQQAAAAMRQLFEEAISESGAESVEVLEAVDTAIGEMLVEFAEVKKAQDEAAEAAERHNAELQEQASAMADAAEAASKQRATSKQKLQEWSEMSRVGSDDLKAWTDHVEKFDKRSAKAGSKRGGLSNFLDLAGQIPGRAGRAASSLSTLISVAGRGGPWAAAAAGIGLVVVGFKRLYDLTENWERNTKRSLPAFEDGLGRAKLQADALARSQQRVADAFDDADGRAQRFLGRMRQLADQQTGIIDAELDEQLALIDLDELEENLTKAEAARARFAARQAAAERKRAIEREQLEKEYEAARSARERREEPLEEAVKASQKADRELDRVSGPGARRDLPQLEELRQAERNARTAYGKILGSSATAEEVEESLARLKEAQEELVNAHDEIIAEVAKAADTARKRKEELQKNANEARRNEADAKTALEDFDTSGERGFDTRRRADKARLDLELRDLANDEAESARDLADRDAADRKKREQRQTQADFDAEGLAITAEGILEKVQPYVANPKGLEPLLKAIADLQDGVVDGEGADLASALESLGEFLPEKLANLEGQVKRAELAARKLEEKIANARSYEP